MPVFLEVAQVIAGYQLQSAVSGSVTLGNFTASLIDKLTTAGTATLGGTYTHRPTVVYSPLTGGFFEAADDPDPAEIGAVHAAVRLFRRRIYGEGLR